MSVLRDVRVPASMLRVPDDFGGTRDGECQRGDLIVRNGRAVALASTPYTNTPRMVVPALTEAHCHLDKCHSGPRLGPVGGDLAVALEIQRQDKTNWTRDDLLARMTRGLKDLIASGCTTVRSHIDWGDNSAPPVSWEILKEVAADTPEISVQQSALTGIDQMADPVFCNAVAQHISKTPGGALGAFVLHHKMIGQGLANMFDAATRYGLALDFHVDEGLGDMNGVEQICDAALATQFEGPILCGHAVALMDKDAQDMARITDKLLETGTHVCALPTTNLYLQGRQQGTPDRRGITRLSELHGAGVPIVLASDNVDDAFCPVGQHDPRAALHLALLTAHLDPPYTRWLPSITHHAASALGNEPVFVDEANLEDLRICSVGTIADLIAGRAPLLPISTLEGV